MKHDELSSGDLTDGNFEDNDLENSFLETTQDSLELSMSGDNSETSFTDTTLSPCILNKQASESEDVQQVALKEDLPNKARQIYLVTYSQADVLKVPSRESFANIVSGEFNRNDQVVEQWCVSAELHRTAGVHYHLAIKLRCPRRFRQARLNLKLNHDIDVDFKGWQDNYYSAYTYVTKFDTHYITSKNHPVLVNPPKTAKATAAKRGAPTPAQSVNNKKQNTYKPPQLTGSQVGDIIRANDLRSPKELYALAKRQANEGKEDLLKYLYKHPNSKQHCDLISTVWSIEEAEQEIKRNKKERIELLIETKDQPCAINSATGASCNGSWLRSALETLTNNNIDRKHFSELVKNSLRHGRGKGRNLLICGPTNCAKSFILMPLTKIFKCFMTPSHGTYNWVDAPQKELIFLNDIRYDMDGEKRVMPWNMFLNLLEGVPINVSMPKNFYARDYEWTEKQPIFATSDKQIIRIRNGQLDVGETQQMAERWVVINFKHQQYLGEDVNYNLIPCGPCFAKLILEA